MQIGQKRRLGQGMTEYNIIVALVTVTMIGILVFHKGKSEVHITLTPGPTKSKNRKTTSVVSVEVNRT